MRVTKFEHAALLIDNGSESLIIDPGNFTRPMEDSAGAVAVVITHEHADHWTAEQLSRILDRNPGIEIIGPQGVADAVAASACPIAVTVAHPGDEVSIGGFSLRFFGGKHAVIHPSLPVVDNLGVLVNNALYYAGDSFVVLEGIAVDALAVPSGAPWLKISEVMDYVDAVKPLVSFPVHEMLLSRAGTDLSNQRIKAATEAHGGTFVALEPGDHLDV